MKASLLRGDLPSTSRDRQVRAGAGFTVVELTIVIVVIGILAGIVLVAYNGISTRAIETSMQSDLDNASSQLALDYKNSGSYPATASAANNGQGLLASGGNVLSYQTTPYGYCVTATNAKTSTIYRLKSNGASRVEAGDCTATVSTLAGSGAIGTADGDPASAQFNYPHTVAVSKDGSVYVADRYNRLIRKISPSGTVSTFAGSSDGFADGTGAAAKFSAFIGITTDQSGNLYVADTFNNRIRKVSPDALVTTLAGDGNQGYVDGPGASAEFLWPSTVAVDDAGNIYVSDPNNYRIRKVTPGGVVSTLAGSGVRGFADGPGATAQFQNTNTSGLAVDHHGNVYLADWDNHRIRKIDPNGNVTTYAGTGNNSYSDGPAATAQFSAPDGIAVDDAGNVYVSENGNRRIRLITTSGMVSTIAGTGASGYVDGPGATAQFKSPAGIAIGPDGAIYVADTDNQRIRKISL